MKTTLFLFLTSLELSASSCRVSIGTVPKNLTMDTLLNWKFSLYDAPPPFRPDADDLLQKPFDQYKTQVDKSFSKAELLKRSRMTTLKTKKSRSSYKTKERFLNNISPTLVGYNIGIPTPVEKKLFNRINLQLVKYGASTPKALTPQFTRPLENTKRLTLDQLRIPRSISGIAAAAPRAIFSVHEIWTASSSLYRCLSETNQTKNCEIDSIRDSFVDVGFELADLVATFATIPFLKARMIIDIILRFSEVSYKTQSSVLKYENMGLHLAENHIITIFLHHLLVLYPLGNEIPFLAKKVSLINEARSNIKDIMELDHSISCAVYSYGYKSKCNIDLSKKQKLKLSRAIGKTSEGFFSCPVPVDENETSFLIEVLENKCDGCGFIKKLNSNLETTKYLIMLQGMTEQSNIILPSAMTSKTVGFIIDHPKSESTNVTINFPQYSLISMVFPEALYFQGMLNLKAHSTFLLTWQEDLDNVELIIEERFGKVLTLNSGFEDWLSHDIDALNVTIQIVGDSNCREIISCSALTYYNSQRVSVNTRGGLNSTHPDIIRDCPFVFLSGFSNFFSSRNATHKLSLTPSFNRTDGDNIKLYLQGTGSVIFNLGPVNVFNTSGKIDSRIAYAGRHPKMNLRLNVDFKNPLSLVIDIEDTNTEFIPITFIDLVSTFSFEIVNFEKNLIGIKRTIHRNEHCPTNINSLNLVPLLEMKDNWIYEGVVSIIHYINCSFIIGSLQDDKMYTVEGWSIIYSRGGQNIIIVEDHYNAYTILKKADHTTRNRIDMHSFDLYNFSHSGQDIHCFNGVTNNTVVVEDYFSRSNIWYFYDSAYQQPLILVRIENQVSTLPYFFHDSMEIYSNEYVVSTARRSRWHSCVIHGFKQNFIYNRIGNSFIIKTVRSVVQNFSIKLENFYLDPAWEDFYVIFTTPDFADSELITRDTVTV